MSKNHCHTLRDNRVAASMSPWVHSLPHASGRRTNAHSTGNWKDQGTHIAGCMLHRQGEQPAGRAHQTQLKRVDIQTGTRLEAPTRCKRSMAARSCRLAGAATALHSCLTIGRGPLSLGGCRTQATYRSKARHKLPCRLHAPVHTSSTFQTLSTCSTVRGNGSPHAVHVHVNSKSSCFRPPGTRVG